jgi:hypothetical protein
MNLIVENRQHAHDRGYTDAYLDRPANSGEGVFAKREGVLPRLEDKRL